MRKNITDIILHTDEIFDEQYVARDNIGIYIKAFVETIRIQFVE